MIINHIIKIVTYQLINILKDSCGDPTPCMHNGVCDGTSGSPVCNCSTAYGYTGVTCNDDINECLGSSHCSNSGICNNTPGSFTCDCTDTGYVGERCETGG